MYPCSCKTALLTAKGSACFLRVFCKIPFGQKLLLADIFLDGDKITDEDDGIARAFSVLISKVHCMAVCFHLKKLFCAVMSAVL